MENSEQQKKNSDSTINTSGCSDVPSHDSRGGQTKFSETANVPLWKFIVPSAAGILFFMIPVKYNDSWTLPVKILANFISNGTGEFLPVL